jgi:putative CocE/NonD family hydrolase
MTATAAARRGSLWARVERRDVPMRDGVRLAADVYRSPGARVPTLLLRTPYGRRLHDRIGEVDPLLGVQQGFAVVIQDLRGRGESEGAFHANWPDAADGADTVAWIRRQRWNDGRVAMLGSSYDGLVQFQAAAARPRGLFAIAPSVAGALRSIWYPGGALRLSGVAGWLGLLLSEALARAEDDHRQAALQELLEASLLERFHAFLERDTLAWEVGAPIRHWIAAPPQDRFWTEVTAVPAAPLPAIHTSGWYDVCAAAATEAYAAWKAVASPEAPQLLTLGPWGHDLGRPPHYPELGLAADDSPPAPAALERQLAFFAASLRGTEAVAELPAVRSFVFGRNRWHEGVCWPPADVRPLALRLARAEEGDGRLVLGDAGAATAVRYRYDPRDPVPTWGGAGALWDRAGPREQVVIEARPDVVTFTSPACDEPLELAGSPTARLVLRSSAPATDVVARLTLVRPDGASLALCEGVWGGRLAELPPAPEAPAHRSCTIALGPLHLALAPGQRLRLQVTSSSAPDLYPNPNTGHDLATGPPPTVHVAEQELLVGGDGGSALELPLRGELRG